MSESMIFFLGGGIVFTLLGIIWLIYHKSPSFYQIIKRDKHDKLTYSQKYGKENAIKISFIFGLVWLIAGLVLLFLAIINYLK